MSLTNAQLTTLKADIAAKHASGQPFENIDPNDLSRDANQFIADWYNGDSSAWTWKSNSTPDEVGMAIDLGEVGGLTTAESNRLSVSFQIRPGGFDPSLQSDRALFGDLFSAAGGVVTRPALIAIWQRMATRGEQLLAASGAGTEVTGDLESDGSVSAGDPFVSGKRMDGTEIGQLNDRDIDDARRLP